MNAAYKAAWILAILSFVVAASTGALMRYGMFAGLPGGLLIGDVRHAHSHLMFFSWATPVLMLLAAEVARRAGSPIRGAAWYAIAAAVAGMLAYVPFLLSGYRLLPLGGAELPLSMMTSGLNGAAWYAFALAYARATWRRPRTVPLRFVDGSVVLLVLSSIGALLLAMGGMTGTATQTQMDAYVDMFLTLFADGWFGLGLLGALTLAVFGVSARTARPLSAAAWTLTVGLGVRTLARLAVDAFGLEALRGLEGLAGVVAAAGWLLAIGLLLGGPGGAKAAVVSDPSAVSKAGPAPQPDALTRGVATAVLALLALKAVFELAIAFPAGEAFVEREGLRIFLLHAFLLGAVSLSLAAAMRALHGRAAWRGLGWFAAAIGVMLACLLPLTGLWPASLAGPWILKAAFYSSFGPPLAALITLAMLLRLTSRASSPSSAPEPVGRGRGTPRSVAPEPSKPPT